MVADARASAAALGASPAPAAVGTSPDGAAVGASPGVAAVGASPGAGAEVGAARVVPERVVPSSIVLPFRGVVQRWEFPVLVVRGEGRAVAFAVADEGVEVAEGAAVVVHANILPAPELDVVMGPGRPRLRASRRSYGPRVYWLSVGDAESGSVRLMMRGRSEVASWHGGAAGAMRIIQEADREKRLWEPAAAGVLARFAGLIDSWTRTDSGACLVVERVDAR